MKFFKEVKDGGPESNVTGYWLAEIKSLFSIVLLKFEDGSRDDYHSHAFNSVNWILRGKVVEERIDNDFPQDDAIRTTYRSSWKPIVTTRENTHRVVSDGTTWVFSLRGPWADTWWEWSRSANKWTELTHGRKAV